VRDGKEAEAKKMLEDQEPYDLGVVKDILRYINAGGGSEYLKKSIRFVQHFESHLQAAAFQEIYQIVQLKDQTTEPEMLLLQKKIRELEEPGTDWDELKKQVDADCRKIISRIVKGIEQKDYSITNYIAESIDSALLYDNMATIVRDFSNGTLENTVLLVGFSRNLPQIPNYCLMTNAILKELEKYKVLELEQGMQLWAHAKYQIEEQPNWHTLNASDKKLCTDAIEKLSLNKEKFFRHFQRHIESSDKLKIKDFYLSNWHFDSIVREFVSFYFNSDVGRTQNLLAAAEAIPPAGPVVRALSQLHEEMARSGHLNSFEEFRLFNLVKRYLSVSVNTSISVELKNRKAFAELKGKAPAWLQELLWPSGSSRFIISNKFTRKQLFVSASNNKVLKWISEQENNDTDNECGWKVRVDPETSLVSFSRSSGLYLGLENKELILTALDSQFMISADDERYAKLFNIQGFCIFYFLLAINYDTLCS
jgi:hypothetical protein